MAPCHSMFKHKPPVDMYESRGLYSKLFLVCDTQLIARYINCMFNDKDTYIWLPCWQGPQTEEIYNITTLLLILSSYVKEEV